MSHVSDASASSASPSSLLRVTRHVVRTLLGSSSWDSHLTDMLETIGRAIGASRCYIVVHETHAATIPVQTMWIASDPASEHLRTDAPAYSMDFDGFPSLAEQLARGELVSQTLSACLPEGRVVLQRAGTKSRLIAPIIVSDHWLGCIGVDDAVSEREWTESEANAIHVIADAIGAAIERTRFEQDHTRFESIIQNSDDAIIAKTLDGIITDWSEGAERIYGYTAAEMIGTSIQRIVPADRHDELHTIMSRLRRGERVEHYETVRVRKDGEEIFVSVSITPIRDWNGEFSGAATVARDITERKQAEFALLVSEERLRLALGAAEVGAWDWHMRTGEVVWSENMERLHGQAPGSFDGTFESYKRSIYAEDVDLVFDEIQRAVHDHSEYQVEYRSLRADGSPQWLNARGRVITDALGRAVRMTGICFDVTERRQMEDARNELLAQLELAHAEADAERRKLRELFQHAPAMMALLEGPDHIFRLANERYYELIGNRDVEGRPVAEVLPELVDQGFIDLLDHVYKHGETIVRNEAPVNLDLDGDGRLELRYISFAYQPIRDVRRQVTGILVHAVDLTGQVQARKRVEELASAVSSERDRLQQIIDVMPEGIAIADRDGTIFLSNETARAIWGQDPPSGDLQSYSVFGAHHPDGSPWPVEELPLSRSILRGEVVLGEQLVVTNGKTGDSSIVLVNSAPLLDANGEVTGGVAVFQDIGPLKELERQKDDFLQSISHDLKNPLTSIRGYLQLLARASGESERSQALIRNVESATDRAITLLDEILDLTRLQMGQQIELARQKTDMVELLSRMVEQYQAVTEKHIIRLDSPFTTLTGEWDSLRLERVFANLLTNAVSYSPNGGNVVVNLIGEEQCDGQWVGVAVADEGLGIPECDMTQLFERYRRGSNVRDQYRGSGLGLTSAKAIVEAHGGHIDVTSAVGQGSTFTVWLPRTGSDQLLVD